MNDIIFSKACEIFQLIENEVNTFKYMELDDQIEGIIYYVNMNMNQNNDDNIMDYDIIDEDFINKIYENCYNTYNNVNYQHMKGESEMIYIEELRETQTFAMLQTVIKDLYEYYQK
jgi:hypothetical protein